MVYFCLHFQGLINPILHTFNLEGDWYINSMPLSDESTIKKFGRTAQQDMTNIDAMNTQFTFWKGSLTLPCDEDPKDTFVDFPGFTKGVLFVNGFNLGRYWPRMGPQRTLYLPGPVLKGSCKENVFLLLEQDSATCLLEHRTGGCFIKSVDKHIIDGAVPREK